MENTKLFLKNNWFKISIIIIVIILLILVFLTTFYFYNLYRNNLDKTYLQQQTEKCAELSNQYIKDNYNNIGGSKSLSAFTAPPDFLKPSGQVVPQYHFNKKLNTCLIFASIITASNTSDDYIASSKLVDLLTNETKLSYVATDISGKFTTYYSPSPITKEEWDEQEQKLMSE